MNLKDFGDLDLIPKAMSVEKLKIHCLGYLFSLKSLLPVFLFSHESMQYVYSLEVPQIFQLHVFLWRSNTFWLTNVLMEL